MSRTAKVTLSHTNADLSQIDISVTDDLWILTYKGRLFTRRDYKPYVSPLSSYPRLVYPSKATATNAADKLNKTFSCLDFSIARVGVLKGTE